MTEGEGVCHMTEKSIRGFWWRCAYGKHPYPSRTRWLSRKRPMVLYWRRYGRAGGCQIYLKISCKALYRQLVLPVIKNENTVFSFLMTDKTVKKSLLDIVP